MSSLGIIPDTGYGGLVVASLPAPAGVTNAYVPPAGFTVSSPLKFYGADCTANRFDPQQLNAFESEMIALGVALLPTGTWNAGSVSNLAALFAGWVAANNRLSMDGDVTITSPQNNQTIVFNHSTQEWNNSDFPYDISTFLKGTITASETVFAYAFPSAVEIALGAPNSVAVATVASTSGMVLTINKNGTSIGTITWGAAATAGSFAFAAAATFASGDVLSITSGASVDASLANVAITLAGFRI
jgi:hypothetical protein